MERNWRWWGGLWYVRVRCRGQGDEKLGLVLLGGKGPSLLGRDRLDRLRLDWRQIHSIDTTINVMRKTQQPLQE